MSDGVSVSGGTVFFTRDGVRRQLASRSGEAFFYELFAQQNFSAAGDYLLYGLPDMRLAEAILEQTEVRTLTVLECDPGIMAYAESALTRKALEERFGPRFSLHLPRSAEAVQRVLAELPADVIVRWYPPSVHTIPEGLPFLRRWLMDLQLRMNNAASGDELTSNMRHNRALGLRNLLAEASGIAQGVPCLILMAGPSLREAAPLLRKLQGRCLLISSGRNGPFFRELGITPDLWVEMDGQNRPEIWERLAHTDPTAPLAILDSASVLVHDYFKGRCLLVRSADSSDDTHALVTGKTTVGAFALDLAAHLGCTPLYFIGQDLCFIGSHSHADGGADVSATVTTGTLLCNDGIERTTTREFLSFQRCIENLIPASGAEVYNCSPHGAVIQGAPYKALETLLDLPVNPRLAAVREFLRAAGAPG
jgi:hypothetical protein